MKINIDRFGLENVQVDPETLFFFPKGMAGFEDFKQFKLFHEEGGGTVFWLQSVDDADVTFPIVAPDTLDITYEIWLSDEDCVLLGVEDEADATDVVVVVIVYRKEAKGNITVNTHSPVILNLKKHIGMQKTLQEVRPGVMYRAR
ncbi:MAG: flagellar assembly protein FliW [Candidatus Accumulibacter sp.]|jgi:flagellar assembly factor FliW|nr:flagellar assembly protein FliW [Accumulibacter sp.]